MSFWGTDYSAVIIVLIPSEFPSQMPWQMLVIILNNIKFGIIRQLS